MLARQICWNFLQVQRPWQVQLLLLTFYLADPALPGAIVYSPHLPNEHNKPHLGGPALAGTPPKRSSTPPHWQMPSVESRASPKQCPTHHSGKCPRLAPQSLQRSSCPSDWTSALEHHKQSEPGPTAAAQGPGLAH